MTIQFHVQPDPSQDLCGKVASLAPTNPFYTFCYIEARRKLLSQPWVLSLRSNGQLFSACTAFTKCGYLNHSLEITSLPTISDDNAFWQGLLGFCQDARVSRLVINSFASSRAKIPELPGQVRRMSREEYVLDLQNPGVWKHLSSHHKRNIKRACKAGLQLRCARDDHACVEHARLVLGSMGRRKNRGESVPQNIQAHSFVAMTQSGVGEVFQASLNDEVLSSVLVLMAEKGAYYHSAGTSPEGMASGASHFVIYEIANTLRTQGKQVFNLGGSEGHNPGLERFKSGFGAAKVELESAEFYLGNAVKRTLGSAVQLLGNVLRSRRSVMQTGRQGYG